MIIEQLDLIAFGQFTDRRLDLSHGPKRFHLIYGPNESGKSTCLRAICSLFFGMPRTSNDDFIHPYKKLRVGATVVDEAGNRVGLIRRKADKNSLFGDDDQSPLDESVMRSLLGGIDESTFTTRFGLSHQQLVAGGKAIVESKGELGEILFAAGAGVGRLRQIESELEQQRSALFLARGKKTLNLRLKELESKRKELRSQQVPPAEYATLTRSLAEAEQEARRIGEQTATITPKLNRLHAYRAAKQIVPVWRRDRDRLKELSDVPSLDEDFAANRREAAAKTESLESQVASIRSQIQEDQRQLDDNRVNAAAIEHEQQIVALFQEVAAREAARKDQDGLQRQANDHNRLLKKSLKDLGIAIAEDAGQDAIDAEIDRLHLSDATQLRINELASDYELIRQQQRDAEERLAALRNQLADLDNRLEQSSAGNELQTLESVLADIGNPDTLIEQLRQRRSECRQAREQCERLQHQLGLADRPLEQAVRLTPPSPKELQQHESRLAEHEADRQRAEQTVEQLRSRQATLRGVLDSLQAERPLPTEQELHEARGQRDAAVEDLAAKRADDRAFYRAVDAVRTAVQRADRLVDTIRAHQEQITRRDATAHDLSQVDRQYDQACGQLQDHSDQLEADWRAWRDLWQPLGISAGNVGEMRSWLNQFQGLLERYESWRNAEEKQQAVESRGQRCERRLRAAIEQTWCVRPPAASAGGIGSELPPIESWDLEPLHDLASELRKQWSAWASEQESLRRKRRETQDAIPAAEAACQASTSRHSEWNTQWQNAIGELAGQSDASPTVINNRLSKITRMFEQRRERDNVLHRIRSIDQDADHFAQRVRTTAQLLGLDEDGNDRAVSEIAAELHQLLTEARQARLERQRLSETLQQGRRRLAENEQQLAAARSQLAELCREAGVDQPEALPAIERQANEKRALVTSVSSDEKQLLLIADGQPLDRFADEVESRDAVSLQQQISELEQSLANCNEQWQTVQQRVGALKRELDAIDGSGRAAELNQDIQFLTARIDHEARQFARLSVASLMLRRSIEHYRQENQSPVLNIACRAFEQLTCGRYTGVRPEFDEKGGSKLFGIQRQADGGGESLVPVEAMSLGTADALYLALRTASLQHQLSAGRAVPVVIDDCLIQLDDARTIAALKLFSQLSTSTQVILFTHHRHLIDLAESSMKPEDYHVHELV